MPEPKRKRSPGAGRKPGPNPPRRNIVAFKGTEAFAEWLDRLAKRERVPKSALIERALVEYSNSRSGEPAPER